MGEKKRKLKRLEKYKIDHPKCCICGGSRDTETIEHAPPKVIFWDKYRLKGMEVPACARCNNGTGAVDQFASFFSIMQSPAFYEGVGSEGMIRYFDKVSRGCLSSIPDFATFFKDDGNILVEFQGVKQQQHKLVFKDEIFSKYLNKWAAKQAIAHWYFKHGSTFSEDGVVFVRWLTNYELMNNDKIPEFISLFDNLDELVQGSLKSGEQFFIKYPNTKSGENIHLMFAAYHGTAFIAAMIDDPEWHNKVTVNVLGNHSAAFQTASTHGIYQIEI